MEFGIFVFVGAQETNLAGSKWDGDRIFMKSFFVLQKRSLLSWPCRAFFKYFYPNL